MVKGWGSTRGFTIVELLIVIVVIALLATITIAGYNGIQNRASDTSVQTDLSRIAKKFEEQRTLDGTTAYPTGSQVSFVVPVNKSHYMTTGISYNLLVCYPTLTEPKEYLIVATAKSGKRFTVSSTEGVREYTGPGLWNSISAPEICQTTKTNTWSASGSGYVRTDTTNGPWRAWVGGN